MSKKRNRRRFYPEFYTDEELEQNEGVGNMNEEEQENVGAAHPGVPEEEMIDEIEKREEAEEPIKEKEEKVDAEQNIFDRTKNYNDLIYPRKADAAAVFKQIENMQKDYIDKKFNVLNADQIIKNINNNEVNNINNIDDNPNPNLNDILIEIPAGMHININEQSQQSPFDETPVSQQQTEPEPVSSSSNPIVYNLNREPAALPVFTNAPEPAELTEFSELSEIENEEIKKMFDTVSENLKESGENILLSLPIFAGLSETKPIPEMTEIEVEQNTENLFAPEMIQTPQPQIIPFDREKAIEYARRWALDRNPNFYNFDDLGGDCTNYISQILLAGGCRMDKSSSLFGWYYNNANDKSPSWTGVEQLHNYLMKERESGIIANEIDMAEVEAGDIVQLSFNGKTFQHTPFIVSVKRNPFGAVSFDSIKVCAHSFDSDNRALSTYQWKKIRFIRILGYKEP